MHEPRHARPPAPRRPPSFRPYFAVLAVCAAGGIAVPLAAAAGPVQLQDAAQAPDLVATVPPVLARAPAPAVPSAPAAAAAHLPATVTVRPGDTLGTVAAAACGSAGDALALAYNNHLADPDQVMPGQVLRVACHASAAALAAAYPPPKPPPTALRAPQAAVAAPAAVVHGTYSCTALEALWDQAGGNPADAFTAAEVAMAESGGNPGAVSPTDDFGLWQINGSNGSLATLNPLGNARAAVTLSHDGTSWGAWTTFTSGAYQGRCS